MAIHDAATRYIAETLESRRNALNVSYARLAEQTGVSKSALQRGLTGSDIPVETLLKVCAALGVSASKLMRDAQALIG
ncbi:MAG: helix-turn-helix domain-containing protein [Propionibacteriaceae bacterium]|jgi:transcriptional regulator with XRE-family HTH domain|nr:helix-turn-helix domain-containing protein [Propionibacteriaceae bacterium]